MATVGGSLSSVETKKALMHFGLAKITAKNQYKAIAEHLGFIPYKKGTTTLLKIGTPAYKKSIETELLRRYGIFKAQHEVQMQNIKDMIQQLKPTPVKAKKPVIAESKLIKKYGRYEKYYFKADNVKDLKDMFNLIKESDEKLGGGTFATLIFLSNIGSGVRRITISQNYMDNFEDFEGRIEQIMKGDLNGSDPIEPDLYTLVLDTFHLSRLPIVSVEGESDGIIFKCLGIESKDKLCGYECLKACGFDYDKEEKIIRPYELRNIDNMVAVIKKHNLRINIVCNGVQLMKSILQIMNGEDKKDTKEKMFYDTKTRKGEMKWINRLYDDEVRKVFYPIYKKDEQAGMSGEDLEAFWDAKGYEPHTIIYDDLGKHFDVVAGDKIELKDELRISLGMELIIDGKVLMTATQCNKNALDKTINEFKYIFFDYETVMDFKMSCCMIPYSLSILVLSKTELYLLNKYDLEKDEKKVKMIRDANCKTFLGYDCSDKFIKWFFENAQDTVFHLVGFNNANFDNFLLLDGLLNYDMEKGGVEFGVKDIFYNGSQLLNFKIDGRHCLFDIRKHLVGSLKANCKSFKINCCSKKSFDHSKAQALHENGELISFITGNDELREYNEYDVLATAVLFKKYQNALLEIPSTKKYAEDLTETITIGSLIYKVFTEHVESMKAEKIRFERYEEKKKNGKLSIEFEKKMMVESKKPFFGKMSYQMYKDLQKYKIAGRVELFNGVMEIFERMASTDVCSLYPFVMAVLNVYYPYGEIEETNIYLGDERIGFYYCDIDQSNLRKDNKPKIYARKTKIENDWNFSDDVILENYLISSVMIELLLKHGCKVRVGKGYVFKGRAKSCKMFRFILEMMEAKNKQDIYKDSKDPKEKEKYIAPLRETLKLLQNSLSGKVIEGLHTEKTVDCSNCAEYDVIRAKAKAVNFIDNIGGKLFITYEVEEEELCEKEQRPIFLGVLIYDYAKRYMYENSYSKIGLDKLYYTDTDASKFKYSDMAPWRKWIETEKVIVPHWPEVELVDPRYKTHLIYNPSSKVYGSFEDELSKMKGVKYSFYCLEKKSWCYAVLNEDGTIAKKIDDDTGELVNDSKFKFKGVNGKAIILKGDEDFIEEKTINKQSGETIKKLMLKAGTEKQVYEYAEMNKEKAIEEGNEVTFFKNLYDTGESYVLANSFRKIVKNSARDVEFGDDDKYNKLINKIQVNYVMKRIQLKGAKYDKAK